MGVREIQRMFEENQQKIEKEVKENFSKGIPTLHRAIENNDITTIKKLIKQRANLNCKNPQEIPAVNFAMKQKKWEIVKLLGKYGVDMNNADQEGKTALSEAVSQCDFGMIAFLLTHGASFEHVPEIKLKQGVDVFSWNEEEGGDNEFHHAIRMKLPIRLFDYFNGERVNDLNGDGQSPLMIGIQENMEMPLFRQLIHMGADWKGRDKNGNSVFHLAIIHQNMGVIKYFTDNNIQDEFLFPNKQHETPTSLSRKVNLPSDVIKSIHRRKEGECSICLDEDKDLYYLEHCGHSFCRECLGGSYFPSFQHHTESFPCPHINCNHSISLGDLEELMSRTQFERYDRILLERHLKSTEDFHWCSECEGGGFYNEFQYDHGAKGYVHAGICSIMQCNSCPAKFCNICMMKIGGEDGESEESHKERCKGYDSLLYIKSLSKICPNCKIFVQHEAGCSHMTCTICKYQFCYICLGPYKGRQVFDMNSSCNC